MEYKIKTQNDCLVLSLVKDITLYEVGRFNEALGQVKKEKDHAKKIVVDLEKVGFIDALALGAFTAFTKEVRDNGGDVKLANVNEDIKSLFELTRLSKIYEIYDNLDKAISSFKR